jgi:hypothetical protein
MESCAETVQLPVEPAPVSPSRHRHGTDDDALLDIVGTSDTELAEEMLSGFTHKDLLYLVGHNPYLRGYLQGYLAELKLQRYVEALPGVTKVTKIPDSAKERGDFDVVYKGVHIVVESKSITTGSVAHDVLTDSWEGKVSFKNSDSRDVVLDGVTLRISNNIKGGFDILAINCFSVERKWQFLFVENRHLPESTRGSGAIITKLAINPIKTPGLTSDLAKLLERVYLRKTAHSG